MEGGLYKLHIKKLETEWETKGGRFTAHWIRERQNLQIYED